MYLNLVGTTSGDLSSMEGMSILDEMRECIPEHFQDIVYVSNLH